MEDNKKLELDSKSFLTFDPFLDNLNDKDLNEYLNMLSETMTTYFDPTVDKETYNVQNRN